MRNKSVSLSMILVVWEFWMYVEYRHLSWKCSSTISHWWSGWMTNDYGPFHAFQGPRWESRRQKGPLHARPAAFFKILISALNWNICVRFVISSCRTKGGMISLIEKRSTLLKATLFSTAITTQEEGDYFGVLVYRYGQNCEIFSLFCFNFNV